ncbi:hypothetical protein B0H19DRAFT_363256 [Mycena capillaripes]|nr:hypothetical protein B0H19DRAFT_363256 [Mycena capillaripes]
MSQSSEYLNLQCRWNWCTVVAPTAVDLLEHVREHVRRTRACYVRDIPLHIRAEEGVGDSISGITIGSGSNQSVTNNSYPALDLSPSLPFPPASSPIPVAAIPTIDFSLLPSTPERPVKRRKIMSPANHSPSLSYSRSNSPRPPSETPPAQLPTSTPNFSTLASSSESAQAIPNPGFPDLDTLISNSLAGGSVPKPLSTPTRTLPYENIGSQSFSGSDGSVERQLTQDVDTSFDDAPNSDEIVRANSLGDSQNLYAGELNWDDESTPNLPRSRSPTPSQSQSQRQRSSASVIDPSSRLSRDIPIQRRQSWYQSPRRTSNPNKSPFGVQQTPPTSSLTRPDPNTPSSQSPISTPVKTYLSGSLKIDSTPELRYGGTINPSVLHELPQYPDFQSQSHSQIPFVIQTQAPYRSQSMSQ